MKKKRQSFLEKTTFHLEKSPKHLHFLAFKPNKKPIQGALLLIWKQFSPQFENYRFTK